MLPPIRDIRLRCCTCKSLGFSRKIERLSGNIRFFGKTAMKYAKQTALGNFMKKSTIIDRGSTAL